MKKILIFLTLSFLVLPLVGQAATCPAGSPPGSVCLDNPLVNKQGKPITEASDLIGTLIKGVLTVLGSITLLMLVWGGFQWLTSAGNAEKVDAGTRTMVWAVIGVILVFSSYILINTLTDFLTKKP